MIKAKKFNQQNPVLTLSYILTFNYADFDYQVFIE